MTDTPEAAFAAALAAFQAELPKVGKGQTATVKTKSGNDYSYSYADLADITEKAAPLLSKHGLAWTATPTLTDAGFILRYALIHTGGHREGGEYPLPDPSKHSPQEIGSYLTYARRYCLTAVTGIAPSGEDDDGVKAQGARSADLKRRKDGHINQQSFYGDRKKAERVKGRTDDEWQMSPVEDMDPAALRAEIATRAQADGVSLDDAAAAFLATTGVEIGVASADVLRPFVAGLRTAGWPVKEAS